jgi:formate hydrogenlyase subunit 3/multisubunit Na+/H+ antiporter MnhD subunit
MAAFVLAISGVRTRRSASNLALFGATVSLAATLLVGWALAKKTAPFLSTYQYLNLPVAITGPVNFQSFVVNIILRVDHLTVVALLVAEVCVIGALGWHRLMGRGEAGAARFHALVSLFLFGIAGALVSYDLVELLAFWGVAGGATYLLLAHRWGLDRPARHSRVALALPFLTDVSLLCGVAILYSRTGVQNLTILIPILHHGTRSLAVSSVLLFIGIGGRLALWPLQSWVTRTAVDAPAAAWAMTQAVWSVLAIAILYRLLPIFMAANPQTLRDCLYACGAAAVIAPLLSLVTNEPRRAIALLGSGVAAVGAAVVIHAGRNPNFTFAVAGVVSVFAAALVRTAGLLAASGVARAMRTNDLTEMGDAWRRMRSSAILLLATGLLLALSATGALVFAVTSSSRLGLVLGEAVLLTSVGAMRIFFAIATGPLHRRRAFEPDRVREAPSSSLNWLYLLVVLGAALIAASLVHNWLDLLDGRKHPAPEIATYLLWAGVVLIGFAAAEFAYLTNKRGATRAWHGLGLWVFRFVAVATDATDRFVIGPATAIAAGTAEWIPTRDDALGRSVVATGRLAAAASRVPVLPAVILLAVLLALIVAVISPGVFR